MLSPNHTKKNSQPITELEFEVVEMDDSQYKSLLHEIYLGLQRIKDAVSSPSEDV